MRCGERGSVRRQRTAWSRSPATRELEIEPMLGARVDEETPQSRGLQCRLGFYGLMALPPVRPIPLGQQDGLRTVGRDLCNRGRVGTTKPDHRRARLHHDVYANPCRKLA
jgi:hypothetical protein